MNLFDHEINKRLMEGNFPTEKLYPVDEYFPHEYDIKVSSEKGISILKNEPNLLYVLFSMFNHLLEEIELCISPEFYMDEVNVLINTGFSADAFYLNKIIDPMIYKCCAVSKVDMIFWYGAKSYYFDNMILDDEHYKENKQEMMFAFIYLLKLVQKKELFYGLTIDPMAISEKICLLDLIESDWNNGNKKYFRKLTKIELEKLNDFDEKIGNLKKECKERLIAQKSIADETNKEWNLFLELINDLSQREKEVIFRINQAASPKEKVDIINRYNTAIDRIERGKYQLKGEEINLLPLLDIIEKRIKDAYSFCVVKTKNDESFLLFPATLSLSFNPQTFNYILMNFHQFRLDPRPQTAKKFVEIALFALKKNLNEKVISHVSINDMIDDFYNTVNNFVIENSNVIDRLSFQKLQNDRAVFNSVCNDFFDLDEQFRDLRNRVVNEFNDMDYIQEIENILTGRRNVLTPERINYFINFEENRATLIKEESKASQIIVSLNIIFLFCETLRIMLSKDRLAKKLKNREYVEKYRRDLMKIDFNLVNKVYSNLDEQEMNMFEYREKIGINTTSLAEKETDEERFRNTVCAEAFKEMISSLVTNIEEKDIDGILKTKADIRMSILMLPNCDVKDSFSDFLDQISQRLSDNLILNCKSKYVDEYQIIKDNINSNLGQQSDILPRSTIDSLTTAEMLYQKYATDDYEKSGFDFSCISALYYQAFEEAYNKLIWLEYAQYLNNLIIDGQKYTDILELNQNHELTIENVKGYLFSKVSTRKIYVDYGSKKDNFETRVKLSCMYGNFISLLKCIKSKSKLDKFCEYFANIVGFKDSETMFNDEVFMKKLSLFTDNIKDCSINRNNASHGGTYISVNQCKVDKKTVLYELESLRSDSLGLIQQLLILLTYNFNSDSDRIAFKSRTED